MRTIGEVINQARIEKGYSRLKLENITKIKREFIKALEEGKWSSLPELPVVQGFVKNISSALEIDKKQASAMLRRDYPPRSLKINPTPDISNKFSWSPKLTFLLALAIAAIAVLTYLTFQYLNFVQPPELQLSLPKENQRVEKTTLEVAGKTSPNASVRINNQPALVDSQGYFSVELEVFEGTSEVIVKATSRSGKETQVVRKVDVKLE